MRSPASPALQTSGTSDAYSNTEVGVRNATPASHALYFESREQPGSTHAGMPSVETGVAGVRIGAKNGRCVLSATPVSEWQASYAGTATCSTGIRMVYLSPL